MIKRPNKPSLRYQSLIPCVSPQFLRGAILLVPLFSFFVYAIFYHTKFFIPLAIVLVVSIFFLSWFDLQLIQKQAEINVIKQDSLEKINLLNVELEKTLQATTAFQKKIVDYSHLKDLTEKLCMALTLADTSRMLSSQVARFFEHSEMTVILYLFEGKTRELAITSSMRKKDRKSKRLNSSH